MALSTRLSTVIHPADLEAPEDEDLLDWELSNRTWFRDMEDENDTVTAVADSDCMDTSEKTTLRELFNASAGLNIIVEKSAWKLGEQSLEDETAYFESLSKPQIDNALPLPKRPRVDSAPAPVPASAPTAPSLSKRVRVSEADNE